MKYKEELADFIEEMNIPRLSFDAVGEQKDRICFVCYQRRRIWEMLEENLSGKALFTVLDILKKELMMPSKEYSLIKLKLTLERKMALIQKGNAGKYLPSVITDLIYCKGTRFEKRQGFQIEDHYWKILITKMIGDSKEERILTDDWDYAVRKSSGWTKYGRLMYSPKLNVLRSQTFAEFYGEGIVD